MQYNQHICFWSTALFTFQIDQNDINFPFTILLQKFVNYAMISNHFEITTQLIKNTKSIDYILLINTCCPWLFVYFNILVTSKIRLWYCIINSISISSNFHMIQAFIDNQKFIDNGKRLRIWFFHLVEILMFPLNVIWNKMWIYYQVFYR